MKFGTFTVKIFYDLETVFLNVMKTYIRILEYWHALYEETPSLVIKNKAAIMLTSDLKQL